MPSRARTLIAIYRKQPTLPALLSPCQVSVVRGVWVVSCYWQLYARFRVAKPRGTLTPGRGGGFCGRCGGFCGKRGGFCGKRGGFWKFTAAENSFSGGESLRDYASCPASAALSVASAGSASAGSAFSSKSVMPASIRILYQVMSFLM